MKIISSILAFYLCTAFTSFSDSNYWMETGNLTNQKDSCITISISVVGDLMCHSPQFEYAKVDKDSFDFEPAFKLVKNYLSASDFTFGNLETVTAGKEYGGYTGYPKFNTPPSYIKALKDAGFDLLTTANNHILDRGEIGVRKTIDEINKNDISYVGASLSQRDRDSIRIFNIKGIRIAFLAYSYGTNENRIPKGKKYLINLIEFDLIKSDIERARKDGAELILVNYHFGDEYKREPVKFQRDVVDSTISYGADLITGGHPHVIQPLMFFKTKKAKLDSGFVAYSMGNFFSNQRKRYTDGGMILTIKIQKDFSTNKIIINEVEFIPTWVFKGYIKDRKQYKIIPEFTDQTKCFYLSKDDSLNMFQSYMDTKEIVKKYSDSPLIRESHK